MWTNQTFLLEPFPGTAQYLLAQLWSAHHSILNKNKCLCHNRTGNGASPTASLVFIHGKRYTKKVKRRQVWNARVLTSSWNMQHETKACMMVHVCMDMYHCHYFDFFSALEAWCLVQHTWGAKLQVYKIENDISRRSRQYLEQKA